MEATVGDKGATVESQSSEKPENPGPQLKCGLGPEGRVKPGADGGVPPRAGSGTSSACPPVLSCLRGCRDQWRDPVHRPLCLLLLAQAPGSGTLRRSRPEWAVRVSY